MIKPILDACCGSQMFYFDKSNENVITMDNRSFETILCDGRKLVVSPKVIGDFRSIPFENETFSGVVFDPPHLIHLGQKSYMGLKYGVLSNTWQEDLKQGFSECFRVLEVGGFLFFKWNEEQIKLSEILVLTERKPLFGDRRSKTHWVIFRKE